MEEERLLDVHHEVTKASTIPSAFYCDKELFEASKDAIFAKSWQFIGSESMVKVPGAVHPFTLLEGTLDEPLLLTRDREDTIHCLSNVCTHRGNLVCEGIGTVNGLRCRYHGRRFGLDGVLQHMPEFEGVEGFPSPADNLPNVPFGSWRKLLFACVEKPEIGPDDYLSAVEKRVGWMPIEDFQFAPERSREYLVNAHWALYVDNYLEGFHIPYIHADLNASLDYSSYRTELFNEGNLQLGVAGNADDCFHLPSQSPDFGEKIAAYYYWLFPNLMLNFYPWGLSVNVVTPLAHNRTKVQFLPFVWDTAKLEEGAGANLDRVEREDEAVVEMTQKGVRSRFYDRGRYSPERELGVHQFHRMIAEAMNR